MKFIMWMVLAGCCATMVGGCAASPAESTSPPVNEQATTQKVGVTTKTGKIVSVGKGYLLQTGSVSLGLDSYTVDFAAYVGEQVRVTGEFSGDTLFVKEINRL